MRLPDDWYRGRGWLWLWWPLSLLFCGLVRLRRRAYRRGWLKQVRLPVPLIIVGNITVGGTGKTPMVLWLAGYLRQQGYRPGLISRGYGGDLQGRVHVVHVDADPRIVGDEALLLARRSGSPMVVGRDRVAAAQTLLEHYPVDVIIADDGMQHYRLGRTIEIAVLDGQRRLGNGWCLPAGPLREPAARLAEVDFVVSNGDALEGEWPMRLEATTVRRLDGRLEERVDTHLGEHDSLTLAQWRNQRVHAVAGIGHPQRFFDFLRMHGIEPVPHPFADHHPYQAGELEFADDLPVLMTEKDAVKYMNHASARHWYLQVEARMPDAFGSALLAKLENSDGQKTA